MRKAKKLLSVVTALSLLMLLVAACGGKADKNTDKENNGAKNGGATDVVANFNETDFPIVNDPITITLMGQDVGVAKWEDMAAFKEAEKLTGIKVATKNAPTDSFETKKNLVFSSGEYPDVFYGAKLTLAEEINYGSQGILIPLENLIDKYAPNLKKVLDENPDIKKSITAPDGHIYSIPSIDLEAKWISNPLWYNGQFLEKLGMEIPQTTDELYTYLKRVKDEDPNGNGVADEIPLSSLKLDDIRGWLLGSWGVYTPRDREHYVDDAGKALYGPIQEGYKHYLEFMNKLWSEDLLDKETFTQTNQQRQAKGKENKLGLFMAYAASFVMGESEPNMNNPMYQPVKSNFVDVPGFVVNPGISTGAFAITDANKYPEATIRWIDFQYSYEGAKLFAIGPEGELWKYTNEETKEKEYLDVPGGMNREDYRATMTPNFGIVVPTIKMEEIHRGLTTPYDDWVKTENAEKLDPIAKIGYPTTFLTEEEQTEVTALMSDMKTYVISMEAKFITGSESLDKWDDYVATLNKMGADKIEAIYQTAYDRWKEN